jgi:hypothetical protein
MQHRLLLLAALAASLLGIVGMVPYIRDIFHRKTKPERAMWWIYTGLFSALFIAQMSAGAKWLLLVSAEYVITSGTVAVLSIRYGYGRFHERDLIAVSIAAVGLVLWAITDNPLTAILMVIVVDFVSFWLTLIKTWHAPHSETLIMWQLAMISAILSVFSIGSWGFTLIIYPVYAVCGTGLIVWVIMYRRIKVKEDPADF